MKIFKREESISFEELAVNLNQKVEKLKETAQTQLKYAISSNNDIDITLDILVSYTYCLRFLSKTHSLIQSPTIIIPQATTLESDAPCIILDLGTISVTSDLTSQLVASKTGAVTSVDYFYDSYMIKMVGLKAFLSTFNEWKKLVH